MNNIVIFSGAHAPNAQYRTLAYNLGTLLSQNGYTVVSGGGPGIMYEVTRGAHEAGGKTIGICIVHRKEEFTPEIFSEYETYNLFDDRNNRLLKMGDAFIVLPGGIGTIVEALQITQRKKFGEIPMDVPLLFVGDFFKPLASVLTNIKSAGFIREDLDRFYSMVSTEKEVIEKLNGYFKNGVV